MLPSSLPHFSYAGVVNDLGEYLKKTVPLGHRNVVFFARKVTIKSDVDLSSTYHQVPVDLSIVCETLEVEPKIATNIVDVSGPSIQTSYSIDLSGKSAPDLVSFHNEREGDAWQGKAGCDGGSISIYAKYKTGTGTLNIDVHGGSGGKGQDGYIGKPGSKGENVAWYDIFGRTDGADGEDGGNGGKGGKAGDAGEIEIDLLLTNPTEVLGASNTSAGKEGKGGAKGTGGDGGPGGGWRWGAFHGSSGSPGKDGQDGPTGDRGQPSKPELHQVDDEQAFYQSMPITGAYLQRALNTEICCILHSKHQADTAQLHEAKCNVTWIGEIAEGAGYGVVKRRCTEMFELCSNGMKLSQDPIQVESAKVRNHFEELNQVVQKAVEVDTLELHHKMHDDKLLNKHAYHARIFNQLGNHFTGYKERYNKAKELARDVNDAPSLNADTEAFLGTAFAQLLSDQLMKTAQEKPYVKMAMSMDGTEVEGVAGVGVVAVAIPEFLKMLMASEAPELLLCVAAIEPPVLAALAAGIVVVVAADAVGKVLGHFHYLFEMHAAEVARYEEAVRARAKLEEQNLLRLRIDTNEPNPPTRRRPYLRTRRRIRPPRPREEPPIPVPESESGKFIGVLDKCEPVESKGSNEVVATFDAIPLFFTTIEPGLKVDLNALDPVQQVELAAQLKLQAIPLGILPGFFITTTLTKGVVNEEALGQWFEFDAVFVGTGRSDAVLIAPSISLVLGELSPIASAVADVNLPVTIQSVEPLNPELQEEVVIELGLSPKVPFLFNKSPIQADTASDLTVQDQSCITQVSVVKVGQGSCNILRDQFGIVKLVYDVGGDGTTMYQPALRGDIMSSPVIVISHWDLDHYRGLLSYPQLANRKVFVVPSYLGARIGKNLRDVITSINERCSNYLEYGQGTGNVGRDQPIPCPGNISNLDLRMTVVRPGVVYRDRNNHGAITACVKDARGIPLFLMPGDASYSFVSDEQKVGLKYLLATHHGSTYSIERDRGGILSIPLPEDNELPKDNTSYLIFSYGRKNKYKHSSMKARRIYSRRRWRYSYATVRSRSEIRVSLDLLGQQIIVPRVDPDESKSAEELEVSTDSSVEST